MQARRANCSTWASAWENVLAVAIKDAARDRVERAVGGMVVLRLTVTDCFSETASQVLWQGHGVPDGAEFCDYLTATVAARLEDAEHGQSFEDDMRDLASTGVGISTLETLLNAQVSRKPWEVGEALAECVLEEGRGVAWPWNSERDKRTPKASLPGADIVGFLVENGDAYIALGEVKTSYDKKRPPQVLHGRGGMINQLDKLAKDSAIHMSLIKWLHIRCKSTDFWPLYQQAASRYLESKGRDIVLFGMLMRDTVPHELDLKNRARNLASRVQDPTRVELTAWYLPRPIREWPQLVAESA